ncbi:MAG: hypothetical protein ACRDVC_06625 [Acidimicrobiales bacterium]
MTQSRHVDLVEEYLSELRAARRQASTSARVEYLSDIASHIDEAREVMDPHDERALRELLDRIGPPLVLAEEFYHNQREHKAEVRAHHRTRSSQALRALRLSGPRRDPRDIGGVVCPPLPAARVRETPPARSSTREERRPHWPPATPSLSRSGWNRRASSP